jgi:hypothetical protein
LSPDNLVVDSTGLGAVQTESDGDQRHGILLLLVLEKSALWSIRDECEKRKKKVTKIRAGKNPLGMGASVCSSETFNEVMDAPAT